MKLTLRPLGRSRYAALWNGRVLAEGRTPVFSAARQLLREGVSDDVILVVAHEGSPITSMTIPVGKAARLTVIERDSGGIHFAPYDADSSDRLRSLQGGPQGAAFCAATDSARIEPETPFCDDHRA